VKYGEILQVAEIYVVVYGESKRITASKTPTLLRTSLIKQVIIRLLTVKEKDIVEYW
jgi:hypothetical protein